MTARPIPEQVRAYAEAFIAWSEGKKVEYRSRTLGNSPEWWLFNGEQFVPGFEYRIIPDPPKAREWWMNIYSNHVGSFAHLSKDEAEKHALLNRLECIQVREILDTEIVVDFTEYKELRRNEAALKAAIKECSNQRKRSLPLDFYLDSHGAKL